MEAGTSSSSPSSSSLSFVPRRVAGTKRRGTGLASKSRPPPPAVAAPGDVDVDFPSHVLLHATLSLNLPTAVVKDSQRLAKQIDRFVRRRLERIAPRSVDYVAVRRLTRSEEIDERGQDGDNSTAKMTVECNIRCSSPLAARALIDKHEHSQKAEPPADHLHRHRRTPAAGLTALRPLTPSEQKAVWRYEVPSKVKSRARRRVSRRLKQEKEERGDAAAVTDVR
ncbi:hypothetical protein BDZ90DRAFT_58253 [Jaminaea rosea]|uniref:Uncharacterized protein n=1 Tax=Jaminaea rosea TaxID=1569628 RepID=A0A316USG5_9BASI|nr:hypothetical protein BDZ90DRAFT_58253 [Jaminaea rosea]PWN26075.1 hypothetical protein BDZ90DRAFT_58253 [Jaminaea rosea]